MSAPTSTDTHRELLADALIRETGADLRLRGANFWSLAQLFPALVASLLTVAVTVLAGAVPGASTLARGLAGGAVALLAAFLGLSAIYSIVFEGFHWARFRRMRARLLTIWPQLASRSEYWDQGLRVEIQLMNRRGSNPRELRESIWEIGGDPAIFHHYISGLRSEVLPNAGVRRALRLMVEILVLAAASVAAASGWVIASSLTGVTSPGLDLGGITVTLLRLLIPTLVVAPLVLAAVRMQSGFKVAGVTMEDPALLIFDLDKTLIDLDPMDKNHRADENWRRPNRSAREAAQKAGVKGVLATTSATDVYRLAITQTGRDSLITREIERILNEVERKLATMAWSLLVTGNDLRKLRRAGHMLGIVTSNGRECIRTLRESTRPDRLPFELFEFCITRDDVSTPKPSAEPIARAIDFARSRQIEIPAWYIGDQENDLRAVLSHNSTALPKNRCRMALVSSRVSRFRLMRLVTENYRETSTGAEKLHEPESISPRHGWPARFTDAGAFCRWILQDSRRN